MSDHEWVATRGGRGALALLVCAALLFAWTLTRAIRLPAVPDLPVPQFAPTAALAAPASTADVDVDAAVEADPFAPTRSAPAQRYRVPGEDAPDATAGGPEVEPVVLGTAWSDLRHSFATVQLGDSRSVILHVGDRIGSYTVKSIERGHVRFSTASGRTLEVTELKP